MEEAALDHGLDLLPIFIGLFLFPFFANATSFGPISLEQQVSNAEYIVRGQIIGSSWVEEERQSRKPYTHWKLKILEQLRGDSLGEETIIRQPGGELGGMGYHVAGSAEFRSGEEVVVNIRTTDTPEIKEVLALASGKYTVEKNAEGTFLRSGLGFLLAGPEGKPLPLSEYTQFVKRINSGDTSDQDRNIFVNNALTHSHPTNSPAVESAPAAAPQALEPKENITAKTPSPNALSHQVTKPPAEKKKGGSLVLFLIAGCVFFFLATLIVIKRMM